MKQQRKQLINWLFEKTMIIYCKFKKKTPWGITTEELLLMPSSSFGYQLGAFLKERDFQLIPKVERHDAYHVLTGFKTNVEDEIALQYLCFGNGKRSPYLLGVLFLGTLILPEYLAYYFESFRIGKSANPFHHFDFKTILDTGFSDFQSIIFSEKQLLQLKQLQMPLVKQNLKLKTT